MDTLPIRRFYLRSTRKWHSRMSVDEERSFNRTLFLVEGESKTASRRQLVPLSFNAQCANSFLQLGESETWLSNIYA